MAEGYLAGLLKGFYDYTADERKRVREAEDAELARREALLKQAYDLANTDESGLSAQHYAQLLKDYMTVQGAASGTRKAKGGVSGFFGATELPMSRFLDAVLSGEIGGMEPAKTVAGMQTEFNSTIPSLDAAGVGVGTLLPPPPPAASPFAGVQMGPGAPPESRPRFSAGPTGPAAPFNSPRLTLAGAPTPPPPPVAPVAPVAPAGPQSFLRRNRVNQKIEENALAQQLKMSNLNDDIRAIEASTHLTPEQKAQAIAALYGATAAVGTTQEGDVIPDPNSPTGHSRIIWGERNGKVQVVGRIPAPAPPLEKPSAADVALARLASAALNSVITVADLATLTPEDLRAIDLYERRQKGSIPQPPPELTDVPSTYTLRQRVDLQQILTRFGNIQAVKDFTEMERYVQGMDAAMKEAQTTKNFVAVDQTLINAFNKLNDPTSVVRESEYARTKNDISLINRLRGKVGIDGKLAVGGAGLTINDREALARMAQRFYVKAKERYDEAYQEASDEADVFMVGEGFRRSRRKKGEQTPTTPAPREGVIDGVPVIWVEGKGWVAK